MIVAFDFDGTLTDIKIQNLALTFVRSKIQVWVITMRKENEHNIKEVKKIIDKLHIPITNVIFCDEKPKLEFIEAINADLYIDNLNNEFSNIINHTNTIPLLWSSR